MSPPREDLIRELAADLQPVPALRRPRDLALLWLGASWLIIAGGMVARAPFRPGALEQLFTARFGGECLLGLAAGGLAIGASIGLGIPGSPGPWRRLAVAGGALALWAACAVYALFDPAFPPSMLGKRPGCVLEVFAWGVPTLVAGLWLLRRLAPFDRVSAGAVLGAAAGAIPGLLMQLACMYLPEHALTHHVAPVAALAALGAVLGPLLLRRI